MVGPMLSARSLLSLIAACITLMAAPLPCAAQGARASAHDLALVDRVTWGRNAQSAAEISKLGAKAWLDRQLHPPPGDRLPAAVQAQIDAPADLARDDAPARGHHGGAGQGLWQDRRPSTRRKPPTRPI